MSPLQIGLLCVLVACVFRLLLGHLTSPLRHIQGPFLARFTDLWRFWDVWKGHAELTQRRLHDEYGDVVLLGPKCVSLTDPALIKVIYGVKEKWIKSDFYSVNDFRIGNRIFPTGFSTRSEQQHTEITRPISNLYSSSSVLRYEDRMETTISTFIDRLSSFADSRMVCPIDKWFHYCAWDIIASITFGSPFGFLDNGHDFQSLIHRSILATDYFAVVGQLPLLDKLLAKNPVCPLGPPSSSAAAAFAAKQLQARLDESDKHDKATAPDFLDDFLAIKNQDPNIPDTRIVQWLMRNVGAGSDSTAISLRSVIYFVCRSANAKAKLQAEIDAHGISEQIQRGKVPAYSDLNKLEYLDAVVQESFRLHPAVALGLERVVPYGGFTLPDGRFLPAGTIVGVNPAVIQRRKDVFGKDADGFRPERWLRGRAEDGQWTESEEEFRTRLERMRGAMLVFGFGKRMCAGRHVAVIETIKITASLLGAFDVEFVGDREWKTRNSWFHYQWGMDVVLTKRAG
ncbi:cytochrome P450 monooxygenase-like protein 31 [Elsinoe australis]|uniref:Cytochrome P450 monooxygenase-like protein 31 n=1 Tax=Elsinoe australis TaxID=40998 RepID=A0A4U7AZ54_9PEZI|nr:cytochrome P450 monooxygenase-like protein 31 [Elsinoe australis]